MAAAHLGRTQSGAGWRRIEGTNFDSKPAANPFDKPPEDYLELGIQRVNEATMTAYDIAVFRAHDFTKELSGKVHRFRVHDQASLYELAKDLARLTADSIDAKAIYSITRYSEARLRLCSPS